jgi:hypothetical protein
MSIKSKVLSVAATLTLLGGVAAAGTLTAGPAKAATPSCDNFLFTSNCINVFSAHFGPSFLLDVFRQGARVGQPIILFRASNTDPALDFTYDFQGTVSETASLGMVSPAVVCHYGGGCTDPNHPGLKNADLNAFELEYAPFGVESGLCVGTAVTPVNGTPVSLQPCGVSGKTIWIEDCKDVGDIAIVGKPPVEVPTCTLANNDFIPLINGATTNFSHPYVLTYPQNGFPTDLPRPQLFTRTLQKFATGNIFENQLWASFTGQA